MKHFALAYAYAALLMGAAGSPAVGQSAPRSDILNEVAETVRRDFYDPKAMPQFEAALGLAQQWAAEGSDVGSAVDRSLASLGASHTGRYTPDGLEYYELFDIFALGRSVGERARSIFPPDGLVNYPGIGLVARPVEGKTFAAYVYHGAPAARAGIEVGDEIVSVDGAPFTPIASFQGKVGRHVRIELRRSAADAPVTVTAPVLAIQPTSTFRDAIRQSVRVVEQEGRRLGYLRIWTFASVGVEDILVELMSSEPLRSVDGLVLDMRSRWGGAPPDAADLFIGRSPHMTVTSRDGNEETASFSWRKPLVGIIDGGTRSGMEILAHALKRAGVPLVGTRTAGAVLAGRVSVLRDNSLLLLAVLDVEVDGIRLEGQGVTPTEEVPFDIRYAHGADPQFDRAVQALGGIIGRR